MENEEVSKGFGDNFLVLIFGDFVQFLGNIFLFLISIAFFELLMRIYFWLLIFKRKILFDMLRFKDIYI